MRVAREEQVEDDGPNRRLYGPKRSFWYTEDEQGRKSYFSDDPEFVIDAAGHQAVADPEWFDRPALIDLEPDERQMLVHGLVDWGGPANGSDALAVAMGFANMHQLHIEAQNLIKAIDTSKPLSIRDWTRALVATEFAFVSEVLGTGLGEWSSITGMDPEHWIAILQRLQDKLPSYAEALRVRPNQ